MRGAACGWGALTVADCRGRGLWIVWGADARFLGG